MEETLARSPPLLRSYVTPVEHASGKRQMLENSNFRLALSGSPPLMGNGFPRRKPGGGQLGKRMRKSGKEGAKVLGGTKLLLMVLPASRECCGDESRGASRSYSPPPPPRLVRMNPPNFCRNRGGTAIAKGRLPPLSWKPRGRLRRFVPGLGRASRGSLEEAAERLAWKAPQF